MQLWIAFRQQIRVISSATGLFYQNKYWIIGSPENAAARSAWKQGNPVNRISPLKKKWSNSCQDKAQRPFRSLSSEHVAQEVGHLLPPPRPVMRDVIAPEVNPRP